jgi:translation initiation factor 1
MGDDSGPVTGLPDELVDDLAAAERNLAVHVERQRFDDEVTVVEGFDPEQADLSALADALAERLGVGSDVVGGTVELKGDHGTQVAELLDEEGFDAKPP